MLALFGFSALALVQSEKAPTPLSVGAFFAGGKFLGLQFHSYHRLVLLFAAWSVDWNIRRLVARRDQPLFAKVSFQFFAADVRKHLTINNHTRRKRLTAELLHLEAILRILDDVLFLVRKVILCENGANAVAPSTVCFQVGRDFNILHDFKCSANWQSPLISFSWSRLDDTPPQQLRRLEPSPPCLPQVVRCQGFPPRGAAHRGRNLRL
jgi:hypothetical protein